MGRGKAATFWGPNVRGDPDLKQKYGGKVVKKITCDKNISIQSQAWSLISQEPSSEPAGHSKKVWAGKAGVLEGLEGARV